MTRQRGPTVTLTLTERVNRVTVLPLHTSSSARCATDIYCKYEHKLPRRQPHHERRHRRRAVHDDCTKIQANAEEASTNGRGHGTGTCNEFYEKAHTNAGPSSNCVESIATATKLIPWLSDSKKTTSTTSHIANMLEKNKSIDSADRPTATWQNIYIFIAAAVAMAYEVFAKREQLLLSEERAARNMYPRVAVPVSLSGRYVISIRGHFTIFTSRGV